MLPFVLAVAAAVATRVERTSGVISPHFGDGGHESEDNNHFYPVIRRGCPLGCSGEKLILRPPPFHLIGLDGGRGLVKRSPIEKKTKKKKKKKAFKKATVKNVKTQVKVSNFIGKKSAKIGLPVTFIQAPVQTTHTVFNKFKKVFQGIFHA